MRSYALPLFLAAAGQVSAQSLAEALAGEESLSALATVLMGYPDLVEALSSASDLTILAPNNEAIASIDPSASSEMIAAILSYHVLNGSFPSSAFSETKAFAPTLLTDSMYTNVTGGQVVSAVMSDDEVMINMGMDASATVVSADMTFDNNGVIHVIDSVLMPPPTIAEALASDVGAELNTTATVLSSVPAIGEALMTSPDLTIFLPANSAWEGINTSALTDEQVARVLQYHVVSDTVAYSTSLSSGNVTTLLGQDLMIEVGEDGSVMVNGNKVIMADMLVANGVVHVIDGVLMPEMEGGEDSEESDDDVVPAAAPGLSAGIAGVFAGAMSLMVLAANF